MLSLVAPLSTRVFSQPSVNRFGQAPEEMAKNPTPNQPSSVLPVAPYVDRVLLQDKLAKPGVYNKFDSEAITQKLTQYLDDQQAHPGEHKPFVILMSGPPGSGKSTIADFLRDDLAEAMRHHGITQRQGPLVETLHLDDYMYKGQPDVQAERTARNTKGAFARYDFEAIRHDLGILMQGKAVNAPLMGNQRDRLDGSRLVIPARILIVEGLPGLQAGHELPNHLSVFIKADQNKLEKRLQERDCLQPPASESKLYKMEHQILHMIPHTLTGAEKADIVINGNLELDQKQQGLKPLGNLLGFMLAPTPRPNHHDWTA